jgi:hypothetical protein
MEKNTLLPSRVLAKDRLRFAEAEMESNGLNPSPRMSITSSLG